MAKPLLVVVDDEPAIGDVISFIAETVGVDIKTTGSADEFRRVVKERGPDVVFMDLVLPGSSASDLIAWMAENGIAADVVLMSGYGEPEIRSAEGVAKDVGVRISRVLNKPFNLDDAETALRNALPA